MLYFCGARQWGGAEIFLGHLLAGLDASVEPVLMGVDAAVLGRLAERRPETRLEVVPRIVDKRDLRAIRAQRRAMDAVRPDVVQLNLPVPYAEPYSVLAALSLRRPAVVVVEHLPTAIPSRGIRLVKRLTSPHLAAHVAVGSAAARTVEAMSGAGPGSVRVVHNGVPRPADLVPPPRPGARLVVGGLGRMHRQKGFDVLIRAAASLTDVHLVLVGDGPEADALQRLAGETGLTGRFTFTGWTDRVSDWLPVLDVVAMPSRFEGLPLVLLEAMAAGRAVVGTEVGSTGDALRDGETGLVVGVDDVAALAEALARLRDDPALRSRLGAGAAERYDAEFTVDAMVRSYRQLYDEVTTRSSHGRLTRRGRSTGGPGQERRPR